jgi:hypothetical protein
LHLILFEDLAFGALSDRLHDPTMPSILRSASDPYADSLRKEVWALSSLLHLDIGVYVADAELSSVFRHTGSSAAGMIENYKPALRCPSRIGLRRPNLVEPGLEHELVQFCLAQQRERIPPTISEVIDGLSEKFITTD